MSSPSVVVLGAGLTGLSAAYHLEQHGRVAYQVLEAESRIGGLARTERVEGFHFDHSIHILYTRDATAAALIHALLGDNIGRQGRRSFCYTAERYTEYPYQTHTFGLPPETVAENILGLVAAREAAGGDPPPHYDAWIQHTFGAGFADNFMRPYNRKQWAWDLTDMAYGWIAERVPVPSLRDVVLGALRRPAAAVGPNHEFWYPRRGGIESLARAFMAHVPAARVRLATRVVGIDGPGHAVITSEGRHTSYGQLISTVPLPVIVRLLGDDVPSTVRAAAAGLKHNVVHTVNVGLQGEGLGAADGMHWVYYPGASTVFHRLSFPHAFSPAMAPPGCCAVQAEISESPHKPVDRTTLVDDTLAGLVRVGLLEAHEARPVAAGGRVAVTQVVTLDPAYVIYDHAHAANVRTIRDYLATRDIQTCGRFGDWEYFNMDASILAGREAALRVKPQAEAMASDA